MAWMAQSPTGERSLVGRITVDCPICGPGIIDIQGHHMRSLLRFLAEWVEQYPELTGPTEADIVQTVRWSGTPPADPITN